MFYENRPFSPIPASQIRGDNSDIASVLLLALDENCSVLATKHFFNGLLDKEPIECMETWYR